MEAVMIRSDRCTLIGVDDYDPEMVDTDQLALGLIGAEMRDRWVCIGCQQRGVLAYVERYQAGEGKTFALCATCLWDRLGDNAAAAEVRDLRELGDHLQSSLSRVVSWIREQGANLEQRMPYEVMMATVEGEAAVDQWTARRSRSR